MLSGEFRGWSIRAITGASAAALYGTAIHTFTPLNLNGSGTVILFISAGACAGIVLPGLMAKMRIRTKAALVTFPLLIFVFYVSKGTSDPGITWMLVGFMIWLANAGLFYLWECIAKRHR